MKLRGTMILTALVSSILGALVVYLGMSVPNDLRADALLKQARQEMTSGQPDRARPVLLKIVQSHPRTDAAAAATVALLSLEQKERAALARTITALKAQGDQQASQSAAQAKRMAELQKQVTTLASAPPKVVMVPAPKPPVRKAPAKKPARRTPTRRR
jgi:hypothetical protein